MFGRGIEQLLDAPGAIRQDPLAGEVVRVVLGHDLVVGGHDLARCRVVALRQILEGDKPVPVVFRVPAGRGRLAFEIVRGLAHRNTAGGDETDVTFDIRVYHALLRRMGIARRREKFVPVARGCESAERLHRQFVLAQRSPGKRQRKVLRQRRGRRLEHIGDQRPVARSAHRQRHVRLALDLDHFAARVELLPALRREYLPGAIDALYIQVLHVRPGVGHAPGDALVAAQHYERYARERRTHHFQARRREMGEIPHSGRRQTQVRIVGEQRLAAGTAAAGQHPVVGSAVLGQAGKRERCELGRIELPIQGAVIGDRQRRIAGIGRQEFADLRGRKLLREAQAQQLRAPVCTQVPGHHLGPGDGIGALPGLGSNPGEQELRRQGARALREKGVDSGRIGIELTACVCAQAFQRGLGHAAHAQGAQELVCVQGRRSQGLGQASAGNAPVHFHLPQAVLRVSETKREIRVRRAGCVNVRHAVAVAHDFHRRLDAGQRERTFELRQGLAQPDVARRCASRTQQKQHKNYANYGFHRFKFP